MTHLYTCTNQTLMSTITETLNDIFAKALPDTGYFTTQYDEHWRSPCEIDQQGELSHWRPTPQTESIDFRGLANAVEAPIHPDVIEYYSGYWSGSLEASAKEGPVSLILLWNPEDVERLIENLVGHLFGKRQSKLPFTTFFATTDPESEYFLSIDNASGKVLLEEPGRPPIKEVASDLNSFLQRLQPDARAPGIF